MDEPDKVNYLIGTWISTKIVWNRIKYGYVGRIRRKAHG